jgi:hypothetical protein
MVSHSLGRGQVILVGMGTLTPPKSKMSRRASQKYQKYQMFSRYSVDTARLRQGLWAQVEPPRRELALDTVAEIGIKGQLLKSCGARIGSFLAPL